MEIIELEVCSFSFEKLKKKSTLKEQFENIPIRQVSVNTLYEEDKIFPYCGMKMVLIGTEIIRTEIKHTRPKIECNEYIVATYSCSECKDAEEH